MQEKTIEKSKIIQENHDQKIIEKNNSIDLLLQTELIKIIAQQISGDTPLNQEKIAQIKEALKNKELTFDSLALAEKIITFEKELFNNDKKI